MKKREEKLLKAIAFYSAVVMTMLEQDGAGVVPHLSDTDDNPGAYLRGLLLEHGIDFEGTGYEFVGKGKQISEGSWYTSNDDLLGETKQ